MGAGVACLRADGRVPLVRRRDNGRWDVPGGGLEPGETPQAGARRELQEETGLSCGPLEPLGIFAGSGMIFSYPDGNTVAWTTHVFLTSGFSGTAEAADDARELGWFAPEAVPGPLSEATRLYLAALLARPELRPQGA